MIPLLCGVHWLTVVRCLYTALSFLESHYSRQQKLQRCLRRITYILQALVVM